MSAHTHTQVSSAICYFLSQCSLRQMSTNTYERPPEIEEEEKTDVRDSSFLFVCLFFKDFCFIMMISWGFAVAASILSTNE